MRKLLTGLQGRVGRVAVVQMIAPPPDPPGSEPWVIDGDLRVEWPSSDFLVIRWLDRAGRQQGSVKVASERHEDAHLRELSRPDDRYAYLFQLEVAEAARGRGAGRKLLLGARYAAARRWRLGIKSVTGEDNAASVRCHEAAGFRPTWRLFGVRLGGKVHWLRRRRVAR